MKLTQYEKSLRTMREKLPPLYFAPRWISRFIVRSIQMTGDISLAYDLLTLTNKEE